MKRSPRNLIDPWLVSHEDRIMKVCDVWKDSKGEIWRGSFAQSRDERT